MVKCSKSKALAKVRNCLKCDFILSFLLKNAMFCTKTVNTPCHVQSAFIIALVCQLVIPPSDCRGPHSLTLRSVSCDQADQVNYLLFSVINHYPVVVSHDCMALPLCDTHFKCSYMSIPHCVVSISKILLEVSSAHTVTVKNVNVNLNVAMEEVFNCFTMANNLVLIRLIPCCIKTVKYVHQPKVGYLEYNKLKYSICRRNNLSVLYYYIWCFCNNITAPLICMLHLISVYLWLCSN